MTTNPKLSRTIAAILGVSAMSLGAASHAARAADADAAATEADAGVQQVIVTAQRRNESVQDVPITVQAISGEQLKELNVTSFNDVIKLLPNVSFGGAGPGQGEIFMRGLSAGPVAGQQSSASILPFPNVAVYLDDQSVQFPGRNLDVYVADMQRIEVLEGPQGTLFGGGAEAGAVRYITNKPALDKFSGNVSAMYGFTEGGDPNSALSAVLNVPVIDGSFALRGVIYEERQGGYIDNLPSTLTRSNNDLGSAGLTTTTGVCPGAPISNGLPTSTGNCVPFNNVVGNNYGLARNNQNPVTYDGIRVEGLLKINDDWDVLLSESYQNMEADGSFSAYPRGSDFGVNPSAPQTLGPWEGTFFTDIYDRDRFENTALTINGKIGGLKVVYTGSFLVRHVDQANDYSNYVRSGSGYYYTCSASGGLAPSGVQVTPKCYSPILPWYDQTKNSHLSNEIRLTTPEDKRLRGLFGVYQENFNIADNMNFEYRSLPGCTAQNLVIANADPSSPCLASIGPVPSSLDLDPTPRNSMVAYGEDERRGYTQIAAFTSIDYDIIPKVLTLTGGTRYYHYREYEFGTRYTTGSDCVNVPACTSTGLDGLDKTGIYGDGNIINPSNPTPANPLLPPAQYTYSGFRSRVNLTWKLTPDTMVYYTFSQGFRPGGFNRFSRLHFGKIPVTTTDASTGVTTVSGGGYQYQNPYSYAPDTLTNNEVGLKTSLFDHRLVINASVYHMSWDNAQFIFFDPVDGFGNSNFVVNGPNYTINGSELQIYFRPGGGFSVQGSGSYNSSQQDNAVCLVANNQALSNAGQCITQTFAGTVHQITSPLGEPGTRPAFSPILQFSIQARYDWRLLNDWLGFATLGAHHTGEMYNQPVGYPLPTMPASSVREFFIQPGFTTYDASIGLSKDALTLTLFGSNLGNSDASTYTNSAQYIEMTTPLRPRVVGLRADYRF